jgi:hypothetical protein
MDRLDDECLSLWEVARHWSRELLAAQQPHELFNRLSAAMWRSDLCTGSDTAQSIVGLNRRLILLRVVASASDHPGLYFISGGGGVTPATLNLPDGSALVDIRHRIMWPSADTGAVELAYQILAEATLADYSADVAPILMEEVVTREEVGRYCDGMGYPRPRFWFAQTKIPGRSSSMARCKRWLSKKAVSGGRPTKADVLAEAKSKFPDLSDRSFEKVWKEAAPEDWKLPGRPQLSRGRKRP